ncbi:hypothetical protein LQZ19_15280 [Treponema primitia]
MNASGILTAAYTITVTNTQKSITLTDFNDEYTGEWTIMLLSSPIIPNPSSDIVAAYQGFPAETTLSGSLYLVTEEGPGDPWTGTGNYYLYLAPRRPGEHPTVKRYRSKNTVAINDTITTYSFTGHFDILPKVIGENLTLTGKVYARSGGTLTPVTTGTVKVYWGGNKETDPVATGTITGSMISIPIVRGDNILSLVKDVPPYNAEGITITPNDLKGGNFELYLESGEHLNIEGDGVIAGSGNMGGFYVYVDKNATIKGTSQSGEISRIYDMTLNQGWNFCSTILTDGVLTIKAADFDTTNYWWAY